MPNDNPVDRFLNRWKQNRDDTRLFEHLAEVHNLDRDDKELLAAIAEAEDVVRLSEIFVRPALVEQSPDRSRWPAAQVKRLRARVFGVTSPANPAAAVDA